MTRVVVQWWRRALFWDKIRDTFAVFGTLTTIGLEGAHVDGVPAYIVMGFTLLGTLLGIWMSDKNNNGIPDILENVHVIENSDQIKDINNEA